MRTFLIVLLTALLSLIGGGVALQEGWINAGSVSNGGNSACTTTQVVKKYEDSSCPIKETGNSCTTPWGTTVDHGGTVLSFESDSANIEDGCVSKTSICNNGNYLDDESPFENERCEIVTPDNCDINGFIFAHGSSQTFYKQGEKIGDERSCDSQERSCVNGVSDGDEEYIYLSCHGGSESCTPTEEKRPEPVVAQPTVEEAPAKTIITPRPISQNVGTQSEPNCPNPFGGYRWEPGQTATGYRSATVGFGQQCESVNLVCAFGSIRFGTKDNPGEIASGVAKSCKVLPAQPCGSACGEVLHGDTVTTFAQAIIPHGNGTSCNDTQIVSTCNDGTLSPSAGSSCSCEIAPPVPCVAPNGQTVPHQNSITLYQYPQVQALPGDGSDTCVRQWRQCVNGSFYDRDGNPASLTFKFATCEVIPPPAGGGPGGEGVPQA